ncbi:MAG: DF family (seleno)protein [Mycobacterium sp.]
MKVELLYFEDCPNWRTADRRLQSLATERGFEVEHRLVSTPEEAEAASFHGSPTILVDGRDPLARGDEPSGLACRLYQTPDGVAGAPTVEQLRAVLGARS